MAKSKLKAVQEARAKVEEATQAFELARKAVEAAAERETIALGELHAARLNLTAVSSAFE